MMNSPARNSRRHNQTHVRLRLCKPTCIRVNGGAHIKVALYNELKRLGVQIYDRIMVTACSPKEADRVPAWSAPRDSTSVPASSIYSTPRRRSSPCLCLRDNGCFPRTTGFGSIFNDPNNSGDGTAMAWNSGAELALMERSGRGLASGFFRYPPYGTGDHNNTWFACSIVDATAKRFPTWTGRGGY